MANDAVLATQYQIDVEDVEYLRHGDKPLLARLYKPRGEDRFPILIDLHGGAWCNKDRLADAGTDEPLARTGVIVLSLDFRMPPDGRYPASLQDVNYAIRWSKARAKEWHGNPDKVAVLGVSSGGHQAMLTAMRPKDPRYSSIPGAGNFDATVQAVVLCWPVIDPLGRFEYAKALKAEGRELKHADNWISSHLKYWKDEAEMAEGSPTRLLDRGEKVQMPPVLYLQVSADIAHPKPNKDHFIATYQKLGGRVEQHLYEGVGEAFVTNDPTSPQARAAIEHIVEFVHRALR